MHRVGAEEGCWRRRSRMEVVVEELHGENESSYFVGAQGVGNKGNTESSRGHYLE